MANDIHCREAVRLLTAALDRELSADESAALEHHLPRCRYCRDYGVQVKFLHEAASRFRDQ